MRGILKHINRSDPSGSPANAYEVRCDHCDVSFPVETKRCIHCGGRTGLRSIFQQEIAPDPGVVFAPTLNPDQLNRQPPQEIDPIDARSELPEETEDERPGGSMFRLAGNLSWILLFAALTLYRACTN
jgi:hypothetical protein